MKKIYAILLLACAMSMPAVEVSEVCGRFRGSLNIGGTTYPDKAVYILPGTEQGKITFVLPDFLYNNASLGDIVLVNIPMDDAGQLSMEDGTLYIKAIRERAGISVLNGFQDGGETYYSFVTDGSAQVLLQISAPSLPEPILVLFAGEKVADRNYAIQNGGFEGSWTNGEPEGWHSFNSATGDYVSFVQNTDQFTKSSETRPGSAGTQSALIQTKIVVGANANGNCTNGRINAGSMTATDAAGNYNFSDPSASGYNTPFAGSPDSLVFWAKYIPADQDPDNEINKARAHVVVTTDARYQDPEVADYSSVKIAEASIDYSATPDMEWQRLSVPFAYTDVDPATAAYVLVTFTTNKEPGGGSSHAEGGLFNKVYYLDNVYLDDVEMVYNHGLQSLLMDGTTLSFSDGQASVEKPYSDSEYDFSAVTDGKAARSFIGFDAARHRVCVYVVADDYSQSQAYSLYTVQMQNPAPPKPESTFFAYEASTCDNEPYSDDLFHDLTEAGIYRDTIPNVLGGDSIVTLTLHVLPTYRMEETRYMNAVDIVWRGQTISGLPQAETPYFYYDSLFSQNGCDSVFVLRLYVSEIPVTYGVYEAGMCEGETVTFEGVTYSEPFEGDIRVTAPNIFGGDSIVRLTVQVLPSYTVTEQMTIVEGEQKRWEGIDLSTLPAGQIELQAMYYTENFCDSVMVLQLTVQPRQVVTAVEQVPSDKVQSIKVLRNGTLYIRRGEEVYDLTGRKVN